MNNEAAAIGGLGANGAQNLLVLNVPDLGKTPMKSPTDPAVTANHIAGGHPRSRATVNAGSLRHITAS